MTREFLLKVVTALCANFQSFENATDLLTDCKVLEAEPIRMELAFSFTKRAKAPQYHLKKVFKLLCTLAVKEECKTAVNKICIAAEELATRRQNNASVQHLLVRISAVVYERLSLSDRAIAQTQINQACSHLPDIASNIIRVLVLGDGYDRTLLPGNGQGVLIHPSAQALSAFELVRHNEDVFLLTANVTRLWEYLPAGFLT